MKINEKNMHVYIPPLLLISLGFELDKVKDMTGGGCRCIGTTTKRVHH